MKTALACLLVGMILGILIVWRAFGLPLWKATLICATLEACKGLGVFGFPGLWSRIVRLTQRPWN
jgi:hypothetical protein